MRHPGWMSESLPANSHSVGGHGGALLETLGCERPAPELGKRGARTHFFFNSRTHPRRIRLRLEKSRNAAGAAPSVPHRPGPAPRGHSEPQRQRRDRIGEGEAPAVAGPPAASRGRSPDRPAGVGFGRGFTSAANLRGTGRSDPPSAAGPTLPSPRQTQGPPQRAPATLLVPATPRRHWRRLRRPARLPRRRRSSRCYPPA
jgi:hypothetical protein